MAVERSGPFKDFFDENVWKQLRDLEGLFIGQFIRALALSCDEGSRNWSSSNALINAPSSTSPDHSKNHDDANQNAATFFSAPDILDGSIAGHGAPHQSQDAFFHFLKQIKAEVSSGTALHVVLDNEGRHPPPSVIDWLARHPRFIFHVTPRSAAWWKSVEALFVSLTKRRAVTSVVELQAALNFRVAERTMTTGPFVWVKSSRRVAVEPSIPASNAIH